MGFPEQRQCTDIAGFDLFWEGEDIRKRADGFIQTSPVLFFHYDQAVCPYCNIAVINFSCEYNYTLCFVSPCESPNVEGGLGTPQTRY